MGSGAKGEAGCGASSLGELSIPPEGPVSSTLPSPVGARPTSPPENGSTNTEHRADRILVLRGGTEESSVRKVS